MRQLGGRARTKLCLYDVMTMLEGAGMNLLPES
jgi:hypothetical protein